VGFARSHLHLPLGIRSGGHGISGRSTNNGGLVIDVGGLNDITILDEDARLVRVGPGARWRDVATALQPYGWALTSGDYGGVGVGGLATAGGIGFLSRKHGLTIDHLRAVEMVLADGTLVRANQDENAELFWAARGAGANFGVAVAFEFEVDEVDEVGWAQLAFQAPDPAAYLEAFGRVVASTPRETTPFLILGQGVAQLMAMVDSSDPDVIVSQLEPFAQIAPLVQQQVVLAPYAAVMNMFPETPHNGRGEPVSRSTFTREITPGFASASADLIRSGASHWYQIRTVGGAVADVPSDATAYAHRDANFALTVMGANAQRLDRWFEPLRRQSQGLYLSFESDPNPERLTDAFPPTTLDRLRRLKAQLDPHNLFRDNFNFTPTHDTARNAS
jgi:FAD/FMN-containing dehydrogenase